MGWLKKLFSRKSTEYEEQNEESSFDALSALGKSIYNKEARQKYVEGCISQMKEASDETDILNREYDMITLRLNDIDEIDSLPDSLKNPIIDKARKILLLENESKTYISKGNHMSDADYEKMKRLEDDMPAAAIGMEEAEQMHKKIKSDLKRIESERDAYSFRRKEVRTTLANIKGILVMAIGAIILCYIMLGVLWIGFDWDIKLGALLATAIVAVTFTILFVKNSEMQRESVRIERSISKLILLQNTVKIRYVNNSNLLDYLHMKYDVDSSEKLKKLWDAYMLEKAEREKYRKVMEDLPESKSELVALISKLHVSDPGIWVNQAEAIVDSREMVELRHGLIMSRQHIRGQIDENRHYAEAAHDEIMRLIKEYPQFSAEIMGMLEKV